MHSLIKASVHDAHRLRMLGLGEVLAEPDHRRVRITKAGEAALAVAFWLSPRRDRSHMRLAAAYLDDE